MIAIRVRKGADWPCPWSAPNGSMGSHATSWELPAAKAHVDEHANCAVYFVRGSMVREIYPNKGKWEKAGGLRISL